jgi:hypothetical protein
MPLQIVDSDWGISLFENCSRKGWPWAVAAGLAGVSVGVGAASAAQNCLSVVGEIVGRRVEIALMAFQTG